MSGSGAGTLGGAQSNTAAFWIERSQLMWFSHTRVLFGTLHLEMFQVVTQGPTQNLVKESFFGIFLEDLGNVARVKGIWVDLVFR